MSAFQLRPVEPEQDFTEIAALLSSQADEPTTPSGLREDHEKHKQQIVRLMAAQDEQGRLAGFAWAWRNQVDPQRLSCELIVKAEHRGHGAGSLLYQDMLEAITQAGAHSLRVNVRDDRPEGRSFALHKGFSELRHLIGMELDLEAFDERPFTGILARLEEQGFRFTTLAELGDTVAARRLLYRLNDTAAASTPGQSGEHAWTSFEDFQNSVCQADWYRPAGQIVAIDTASGAWAGMSAITRMEGQAYAWNLFTGVDLPYRGRKLGQAVKVLALRYASNILKTKLVRTSHLATNLPMIAIDRKFGYHVIPGTYLLERKIG
jgi:GNAT superfamily N-acetyltransferase